MKPPYSTTEFSVATRPLPSGKESSLKPFRKVHRVDDLLEELHEQGARASIFERNESDAGKLDVFDDIESFTSFAFGNLFNGRRTDEEGLEGLIDVQCRSNRKIYSKENPAIAEKLEDAERFMLTRIMRTLRTFP